MTIQFRTFLIVGIMISSLRLSYAQLDFAHEVGVFAGPVAFQSDFGLDGDSKLTTSITGFSVGIMHYVNFSYKADCGCYARNTFFNNHFKLRSEISFNRSVLEHEGNFENETPEDQERLRAHTAEVQNIDLGVQLEFYFKNNREFSNAKFGFNPFISAGFHYVSFTPRVKTTYNNGDSEDPLNFYSVWERASDGDDFLSSQSASTWSYVVNLGTRFKIARLSDLFVEVRYQQYFDDFMDGLNPNLPSNTKNDGLLWFNFGYIYYIN